MKNCRKVVLVSASALLKEATAYLASAGVDSPRLDSRLLLAYVLGIAPQSLVSYGNRSLQAEQRVAFAALLARRAQHEPVSRILGKRGFWTLDLRLSAATFDPRPESETVVEAVLKQVLDRQTPYVLLDLGTGSGCLLLALLTELPNAVGIGVDITDSAIVMARVNAIAAGLAARALFQCGDWGKELINTFDIIVANPPYIAESDLDSLAPEVRFDPRCALIGGSDGLAAYRALAPHVFRLLRPTGFIALEVCQEQSLLVEEVMKKASLELIRSCIDLSGAVRCLLFQRMDKMKEHEKSSWKQARF